MSAENPALAGTNADNNSDSESDSASFMGTVYEISSPNLCYSDGRRMVYIGSTTKPLKTRFAGHKCSKYNTCRSSLIMEVGEASPRVLEYKMYCSSQEMRMRERYFMSLNPELVVNNQMPGRTQQEYNHYYWLKNRNKTVCCEICGCSYSFKNIARHLKTHT
jgi:hypothetical protein